MLRSVFPSESNREDVLAFYAAFEKNGGQCIGCKHGKDYALWLTDMQNRRAGKNLPQGYVQENFYLCYSGEEMVGVCSLKPELTEYLFQLENTLYDPEEAVTVKRYWIDL